MSSPVAPSKTVPEGLALVGTSCVRSGLIRMRARTLAVKPPQATMRERVLRVFVPEGERPSTVQPRPSGLKFVTGLERAVRQPKRLRCAMSAIT